MNEKNMIELADEDLDAVAGGVGPAAAVLITRALAVSGVYTLADRLVDGLSGIHSTLSGIGGSLDNIGDINAP